MKDVYIVSDNIISPLGNTTAANFSSLRVGASGVMLQDRPRVADHPFYAALLPEMPAQQDHTPYTRFEQLLIESVTSAIEDTGIDLANKKTILVISSTKGNISLIEEEEITTGLKNRVALHTSARLVAGHFRCANPPLVVSNACISGLLAMLTARRLLASGQYDNAVVVGADLVSKFIFSGFESFQAVSPAPCRPFDAARNGINLGEG